jgi:hypothetical protein
MKAFDEQEEAEHNDEGNVKVIPEYRKRQQGFSNEHPRLVIEPLVKAPYELSLQTDRQVRLASTSRGCRGPKNMRCSILPDKSARRKPKLART